MIARSDLGEAGFAHELFHKCHWDSADAALIPLCERQGHVATQALFLRGRIALRRERTEAAEAIARRLAARADDTAAGLALVLRAGCELRRGEVERARHTIASGRTSASPVIRGHLACEEALAHFIEPSRRPYIPSTESFAAFPNITARLLILQSWHKQQRGHWREQLGALDQALIVLKSASDPDRYLQAVALHAKAAVVRERPARASTASLAYDIENFPWTSDIEREQFYCFSNVGWLALLEGDAMRAYRFIRKAQRVATTSPAHLAVALSDSAAIADVVNDRTSASADREEALDLVTSIPDVALSDESSNVLVSLAEGFAPTHPVNATLLLNRFSSLAPRRSKMHPPVAGNALLEGMVAYARGLVARHDGSKQAAAHFEAAYRSFESAEYVWRAAIVARTLAQISNAPRWRAQYERLSASYPRSWFASSAQDTVILSVAQREVLKLLIIGNQIGDIARERGTSINTVRNQLAQIRRRYGVSSNARLLVKLREAS